MSRNILQSVSLHSFGYSSIDLDFADSKLAIDHFRAHLASGKETIYMRIGSVHSGRIQWYTLSGKVTVTISPCDGITGKRLEMRV